MKKPNLTYDVALSKVLNGYLNWKSISAPDCFEYTGEKLAKLKPSEATVRFWTELPGFVIHCDLCLPDRVISTVEEKRYRNRKYKLYSELSFDDIKQVAYQVTTRVRLQRATS